MKVIHWCEICNDAPANGVLNVLRTGEVEVTMMFACQKCVNELQPEDWIDNARL